MNLKARPEFAVGLDAFVWDVLQRFKSNDKNEYYWELAVSLAKEIGYSYMNIASVSKYNGMPLWCRTTMAQEWVERYLEKEYFTSDPLIAHMQHSNDHFVMTGEKLDVTAEEPGPQQAFAIDYRRLGFGKFRGIPFNWPTQSTYRIVTFGFMGHDTGEESETMIRKAQVLTEVFSTRITAPSDSVSIGAIWPARAILSDREKELLGLLALGLKNERIAEKSGLAEVTVRKHLLSARQKLGAATREQALAIALQNGLISL